MSLPVLLRTSTPIVLLSAFDHYNGPEVNLTGYNRKSAGKKVGFDDLCVVQAVTGPLKC